MPVKYTVKQGDEILTSHSGLVLIGALLNRTGLRERLSKTELDDCKRPTISHADTVFAMTGLICLGKPDYEAVELFRDNPFFLQSLGLNACPSGPALRQRIDIIKNSFDTIIKEESADLIRRIAPQISAVQTGCGNFVPLDIDVSPFDNSKTVKEGVSRTYKGFDGYSPIFAYLGQEGFLVNFELREGVQHCQKNTPRFITSSIGYAKKITGQKLLLRLDSGNDASENIAVCRLQGADFIIKRNLRKEKPEAWLKLASEKTQPVQCREGKRIFRGKTDNDLKGNSLSTPIYFEITERTIVKGQHLIVPEITADTYWSSLDLDPCEIVLLYHDHGTSEQFHSELRTDMDLERLPSGKFASNALMLLLGMLSYNLLRLCGQEGLREDNGNTLKTPAVRKKASRRRIRTVMLDLMYMAGRVIRSSRKFFISFGKMNPFAPLWNSVYNSFTSDTG